MYVNEAEDTFMNFLGAISGKSSKYRIFAEKQIDFLLSTKCV